MRLIRLILAVFMLLVVAGIAHAATLHGKIYDIELNELNNVVVEVDSEPKQRYVSKDGAYSFELNPGDYVVTASYMPDELHEYMTAENVLIKEEGDFVYDLFLFPDFDVEVEELLQEEDVFDVGETVVDENGKISGVTIAIIAIAVIVFLLVIYFIVGRRKKQEEKAELKEIDKAKKQIKQQPKKVVSEEVADTDLQKVIDVIKKEGGRTTQKELRKQIPLSEAKISLMISELEHKKIIQKVKKGRGNVLILKKK
ncbi:hypothetical protein KY349_03150 [Candidatus Woesearchaeota archaeon]|nr:hypothetical protein [Candidatus Woesearchaeota archaeon]